MDNNDNKGAVAATDDKAAPAQSDEIIDGSHHDAYAVLNELETEDGKAQEGASAEGGKSDEDKTKETKAEDDGQGGEADASKDGDKAAQASDEGAASDSGEPVAKSEEPGQEGDDQPISPGAARRKRRREAAAADKKMIDDQQREIEELRKENEALKEVDIDEAEDIDQAIADNAASKALRAQNDAKIKSKTDKLERQKSEAIVAARDDLIEAGKELTHIKDFEEKVFADDVKFTPDTAGLILSGKIKPELAYKLATDPTELARLNSMSENERAMELGAMNAQFKAPKPPKTSNAPAPIKPTDGPAPTEAKPESEMTYEEMRKHLNMNPSGPGYASN